MNGRQLHRMGTFVLSLAMVAVGFALVVQGLDARSGVSASRLLLGALFITAGVARSYLEIRRGSGS